VIGEKTVKDEGEDDEEVIVDDTVNITRKLSFPMKAAESIP